MAHPHGPAGEGTGQVSPGAVLTVLLGVRGPVCGDGEMLRAGTGGWAVPSGAQQPNSHSGPNTGLAGAAGPHHHPCGMVAALQHPCSVPRLSVWCALSSYSSHNKGQASSRQKKRHREDIEVRPTRSGVFLEALCAQGWELAGR